MPSLGDERVKNWFLWFPMKVRGEWHWWIRVKTVHTYVTFPYPRWISLGTFVR